MLAVRNVKIKHGSLLSPLPKTNLAAHYYGYLIWLFFTSRAVKYDASKTRLKSSEEVPSKKQGLVLIYIFFTHFPPETPFLKAVTHSLSAVTSIHSIS